MTQEQIDKIMAAMNDPVFMQAHFDSIKAIEDKENSQADRLYNLVKDNFDSFIEKVIKKFPPYGNREYIKYRLFNYASRHGTEIKLDKDWPTDSFILDGWIISCTYGQGSFVWFKKHD